MGEGGSELSNYVPHTSKVLAQVLKWTNNHKKLPKNKVFQVVSFSYVHN